MVSRACASSQLGAKADHVTVHSRNSSTCAAAAERFFNRLEVILFGGSKFSKDHDFSVAAGCIARCCGGGVGHSEYHTFGHVQ